MKRWLVTTVLMSVVVWAAARQCTISGYVRDTTSAESLISAAVYDTLSMRGTVTNAYGFYSLTVPEGRCVLRFSYVGYRPEMVEMVVTGDTAIAVGLWSASEIDEVVVTGHRSEIGVHGTQMSAIEMPMPVLKNIPALAGEVDVIKALQLLPGVQSGSEGGTGLYVRGGGPDENLVLLDGIPLYNVSHLGGFFSVFNADAIKNVTLYKGNFPARFGSRLSSVVDVRQNDGNAREYHGNVSVGLLSAKFNVEGPIWKDRTTSNISARRTYYDLLIQPVMAIIASPPEYDPDYRPTPVGYYLWEVPEDIRPGDTLTLTASAAGLPAVRSEVVVPYPIEISLLERKEVDYYGSMLRLTLQLDYDAPTDEPTGLAFRAATTEIYHNPVYDPDNDYEIIPDTFANDTVENDYFYSNDMLFYESDVMDWENDDMVMGTTMKSSADVRTFPYRFDIMVQYHAEGNIDSDKDNTYLGTMITVNTISYGKYRHHITRDAADYAESNPFAEPVQIYSNIEGGAGYFGVVWGRELKIRGDTE